MNFIEFNGKNIHFVKKNGIYWIGIKSVCEALNVDYIRQYKNIREDDILISALSKQTMQIPSDDQKREYVCIMEDFVYGWIFQIRSESSELKEYKKECYRVLLNHFRGTITKQVELYREISKAKKVMSDFENEISKLGRYSDYIDAKMRYARLWKQLKGNASSPDLFDDEEFL